MFLRRCLTLAVLAMMTAGVAACGENSKSSGWSISIDIREDVPVASNLSAAGRAQNRRVEIIIRPNA